MHHIPRTQDAIYQGISDLNSGNGAKQIFPRISRVNINEFLKSDRGLALIFWAMNIGYEQDLFYVTETEWRQDRARKISRIGSVVDSHTHYIERIDGREAIHTGAQYLNGAQGHWWFMPEAYNFQDIDDRVIKIGLNGARDLHSIEHYEQFQAITFNRLNGNFQFFITPAPFSGANILNGINDTTTAITLTSDCERLNKNFGKNTVNSYGYIDVGPNGPRLSMPLAANKSKLWKLYPLEATWPAWIDHHLDTVLDQINTKGHTICIHWWDGDQNPIELNLSRHLREYPNVNFVLFHSCFPWIMEISALLNEMKIEKGKKIRAYPNLFVEIGGTFANQILGGHGDDARPAGLDGRPIGPVAAQEMISTLRGSINKNIGHNDGHILWGTDAIWHGSSIWQIAALHRLILKDSNDPLDPKSSSTLPISSIKSKILGKNAPSVFSILTGN